MNFEELRKILSISSSVIIVENGKPEFIVVKYDEYRKMSDRESAEGYFGSMEPISKKLTEKEAEIVDRINKDILALKQEIADQEKEIEAID